MRRDAWFILAVGLVLVVGAGLRFGSPVTGHGLMYDEDDIVVPIDDILTRGWSVETAIDYEETKGPAMIWPYAALAEGADDRLNALRLVSLGCFIAGCVPLLVIARRTGVTGPGLVGVAALYVLLPYHATLGQLVMSEASFVLGGLVLWFVFVRGLEARGAARTMWIVAYGLVLAVLLHHRVHAVAYAGAACVVALEREGRSSWPWWLASIAAGLLRLPLWLRWGGLVSPAYQSMFGLGFAPEAVIYLAAALPLVTAIFLVPMVARRERAPCVALAGLGLVSFGLALVLAPDLSEKFVRAGAPTARFAGIAASAVRGVAGGGVMAHLLLAASAAIGVAGLGALALEAWRRDARSPDGAVLRIVTWTIAIGIGLYVATRSMVFDRYLLAWAILAPIAWVRVLPRRATWAQGLLLLAVTAWLVRQWLVIGGPNAAGS